MRFDAWSEPGSDTKPNEDWCGSTDSVAVLLDGVTSPAGLETGCVHGVPWFVEHLGRELLDVASGDPSVPLQGCLGSAIARIAALHEVSCDLAHKGTPSATVLVIRAHGEMLEYLVLSDSTLVLESEGQIRVITDSSLNLVAQEEREWVGKQPLGSPEHDEAVRALVTKQRSWRNVNGGYWLVAATPEASSQALTGAVPLRQLRRGALLSDGASCLVDRYECCTWKELLDLIDAGGARRVVDEVRKVENADKQGELWARYKASDDSTVLAFKT